MSKIIDRRYRKLIEKELAGQFKESKELEEKIKENLKRVRFEI